MAVLKYSDLADSGLYVKTSTKGVANGVASLDSNGKVPTIQLPEGVGGGVAGVSSFNGRTGVVTLVAGDVPNLDASKITSGTIDASRLPSSSSGYRFKVTFTGSLPSLISELPSGWSSSINGSLVTITHTVGVMPKFMSYFGYNSGEFSYRTPTFANELKVSEGSQTTSFNFAIANDVAGAAQGAYAYVNILF